MTTKDIQLLIQQGEGDHLDAKSGKGGFPDSLWESYSAFANTDGGIILLGIEEDNNHNLNQKGLSDAEKAKDTFWKLVNNRQKISHNVVLNQGVYITHMDNKDILVIEVPRAERTVRPVYKGTDPRKGSYKRYGDADHLCSVEEVGAMMRDASISPLDAAPVKELDLSALNVESINGYRQMFRAANPKHLWNQLDNDLFLRRIKAADAADDGVFHPTEAGLLMFGYEYEITRRFPMYFLDYQEDREVIGLTRWKDRVVSSSGDWSGNVFDFILKVLTKLQSDLKVPFVVKGVQRIDDTPLHRLLREAATNCLVHADYYGRQGMVIRKSKEGFEFANPGGLRIPKSEAIAGGVSDPRNATLLKMFSLIRFGERAGSGLNGIMQVWSAVYHTSPVIFEKADADRTILLLPTNGKEPDAEALRGFYDDVEVEENGNDPMIKQEGEKPLPKKTVEKTVEKIIALIKENPKITQAELADLTGLSRRGIEWNIQQLKSLGLLTRIGPDKGGWWKVEE